MSPLWPETVHAGLFAGHCWLQRGRRVPEQRFESSSGAPTEPSTAFDSSALLLTFEKMLEEQVQPLRKGSRLTLTVSDSVASIATLPWQDALNRPAEIDRYARICFEKLGIMLDNDTAMHAEFRHFQGTGLAYALPREWLEALLELVRARGLRLMAVLPVSAAAYCRQRLNATKQTTLFLLQEASHAAAMIYGTGGLLGYDVEPLTRSIDATRMRLLRRAASGYADIGRVMCWSSDASASTPPIEVVSTCFAGAESACLKRNVWS